VIRRDRHDNEDQLPASLLRELISKYYRVLLKEATENAKIGDLVKMIKLHQELAPEGAAQKELWNRIARIRREVLSGKSKNQQSGNKTTRSKGKRS